MSLLAFSAPLLSAQEYRTFTSADGAEIEATVIELKDGESVTIRRRDGRTFKDVDLSLFSREDRTYLKEWRKKERAKYDNALLTSESRVKVTVLTGRDEDQNDYGDIDDRVIDLEPKVVIENEDIKKTFQNISGTVAIVGRGVVEKDVYVIITKQDFKGLTVAPRSKARWEGHMTTVRYDPDYGGFEYEGYLVVLRNRNNEIVACKASKSFWENAPSRILKAEKLRGYDRKFEKDRPLFSTWGLPE